LSTRRTLIPESNLGTAGERIGTQAELDFRVSKGGDVLFGAEKHECDAYREDEARQCRNLRFRQPILGFDQSANSGLQSGGVAHRRAQ
jgi:hypothetical protein